MALEAVTDTKANVTASVAKDQQSKQAAFESSLSEAGKSGKQSASKHNTSSNLIENSVQAANTHLSYLENGMTVWSPGLYAVKIPAMAVLLSWKYG